MAGRKLIGTRCTHEHSVWLAVGDSMCCFVCPRVSLMHAVFVAADSRPKISPSPITGILSVTIILTGATKTSTRSEKIHSPSQQNILFPSKTKLGLRKGEAIVGLKVSGCLRQHEAVCKCAHQCHPRVHLRFKPCSWWIEWNFPNNSLMIDSELVITLLAVHTFTFPPSSHLRKEYRAEGCSQGRKNNQIQSACLH